MYKPVQIGVPRSQEEAVRYHEFYTSQEQLAESVYCVWALYTIRPLGSDFSYLVLPDGCIDIIFDLRATPEFTGTLIMTPSISAERLTIGREFYYAGIRLYPGAWNAEAIEVVGSAQVHEVFSGCDFRKLRANLTAQDPAILSGQLQRVADQLAEAGVIGPSPFLKRLLEAPTTSVEDMTRSSGYSRRQLQRILKQRVGYTPHDFIKIIRFQRALSNGRAAVEEFSDQSHFIRECKRITGMTPRELRTTFRLT